MAAGRRVVVAGGGVAGAYAARLLEDAADVTLVDSKDYFEIRWGELRGYVEPAAAEKFVIPHKEYLKKANVAVGVIRTATTSSVILANGTMIDFDFLVIATGSKSTAYPQLSAAERLDWFNAEAKRYEGAESFLIVGGGPVGVELAGELVTDLPSKKVTLVHSGPRLLEFIKPKASAKALAWLKSKGVEVILEDRVERSSVAEGAKVHSTRNGKSVIVDVVLFATGSTPDASWLIDSFAKNLDSGGREHVDSTLRLEGHNNIFAIGDITDVKEAKQGYFAKAHAKVAAQNIAKLLVDPAAKGLKTYKAGPDIALVSLGRADGVAQLPFGTFTGWFPAAMKSKSLFIPKTRGELGLKA